MKKLGRKALALSLTVVMGTSNVINRMVAQVAQMERTEVLIVQKI